MRMQQQQQQLQEQSEVSADRLDRLVFALAHAGMLCVSVTVLIIWLSYDSSECPLAFS